MGTGLSKEHIWSDWLSRLIPPNNAHGQYWGSMHRDSGTGNIEWTELPGSATREGSVLQRKVRNVCKRCNNGWMSRVVDRAKSHTEKLILGKTTHLNRQAQIDLAAWIGVTTITQEFANRGRRPRIPAQDRLAFMDTGAPPLSWSIWVARYAGKWWAPMGHYHIPMSLLQATAR